MFVFLLDGFKEILQANKDAESAKLEVSEAGLSKSNIYILIHLLPIYYLVQLQAVMIQLKYKKLSEKAIAPSYAKERRCRFRYKLYHL